MTAWKAKVWKELYEYSDSLCVTKETANLEDILCFTNSQGKEVIGTVREFHDEPGVVLMPLWMIYSIQITQRLRMKVMEKIRCTKIFFKPYNSGFTNLPNWIRDLQTGMNLYKSITVGTTIPMNVGGFLQLYIDRVYPETHTTFFIANGGGVNVEILPSFEEAPPKPVAPSMDSHFVSKPFHLRDEPPEKLHVFGGTTYGFMGKADTSRTPAQNAYLAAKQRVEETNTYCEKIDK